MADNWQFTLIVDGKQLLLDEAASTGPHCNVDMQQGDSAVLGMCTGQTGVQCINFLCGWHLSQVMVAHMCYLSSSTHSRALRYMDREMATQIVCILYWPTYSCTHLDFIEGCVF